MRLHSSAFLRALCLLLYMAPAFFVEPVSQNTTTGTVTITENHSSITETQFIDFTATTTITTITNNNSTANMATTGTTSSETSSPTTTARLTPSTKSVSESSPTSKSYAGTLVCVLFFLCLLILLFYFAYKWYTRNGRPSFREIWRIVAESARNVWPTVVERLRRSSKQGDEEVVEMEAEGEKKQGGGAEDDDDDDSSDDYSSLGGMGMMEGLRKDEEEDGQRKEKDDDMTSVELKDEKMEQEKDERDLTVL